MSPVRWTCVPPHSSLLKPRDGDDANAIAVFFAEQRHGAGVERLIEIHDVGVDFDVFQNLFVHELLNFGQLFGIGVGVMRKVETQPIGIDNAAGLLDVRAEHFAQRGVQQVRGGVVAHGGVAQVAVDAADQFIAFANRREHLDTVHRGAGRWFIRVAHEWRPCHRSKAKPGRRYRRPGRQLRRRTACG